MMRHGCSLQSCILSEDVVGLGVKIPISRKNYNTEIKWLNHQFNRQPLLKLISLPEVCHVQFLVQLFCCCNRTVLWGC